MQPGDVDAVGIDVPERVEHLSGGGDLARFGDAHTAPGDVLIIADAHAEPRDRAVALYESGRSVLAVAQNPESQSSANGSTLTFPAGGSL